MAPHKYSKAVERLIQIGGHIADREDLPVDLGGLREYDEINRQGREFWRSVAADLDNFQLVNLLRGLVYAERELHWIGGSGASSIWLFAVFAGRERNTAKVDAIANWAVRNTQNPYVPFGSSVIRAATYTEFLAIRAERAALHKKYDVEQSMAAEHRRVRANRRAYGAARRSTDERTDLIARINTLAINEQLEQIADDDTYCPNFYPTCCADAASTTVISQLPEDVRMRLAVKLKGKHRGPWGAFKKRLHATFERSPFATPPLT